MICIARIDGELNRVRGDNGNMKEYRKEIDKCISAELNNYTTIVVAKRASEFKKIPVVPLLITKIVRRLRKFI